MSFAQFGTPFGTKHSRTTVIRGRGNRIDTVPSVGPDAVVGLGRGERLARVVELEVEAECDRVCTGGSPGALGGSIGAGTPLVGPAPGAALNAKPQPLPGDHDACGPTWS